MKKFALMFAALVFLAVPALPGSHLQMAEARTAGNVIPHEETVYVTKTGSKFHKSSCRHVKKSMIAMKKSEAIKKGYKACTVCKP